MITGSGNKKVAFIRNKTTQQINSNVEEFISIPKKFTQI